MKENGVPLKKAKKTEDILQKPLWIQTTQMI